LDSGRWARTPIELYAIVPARQPALLGLISIYVLLAVAAFLT
jgi:hypothetical protein